MHLGGGASIIFDPLGCLEPKICRPLMEICLFSGPITTIEWDMLDKRRYYPYSMVSSFTVRCCLYPLTVVRTRLQVGKQLLSTHMALNVRCCLKVVRNSSQGDKSFQPLGTQRKMLHFLVGSKYSFF